MGAEEARVESKRADADRPLAAGAGFPDAAGVRGRAPAGGEEAREDCLVEAAVEWAETEARASSLAESLALFARACR
eukprot:207314-Prorocentrum_minimum.AAC.1